VAEDVATKRARTEGARHGDAVRVPGRWSPRAAMKRAGDVGRPRKRRRGRRVRLDGAGQGEAAPSPGGGRRDAGGEDLRGTRWHSDEKSEPEEGKGNRGVQEVRKGTRNT
jgi:hypothetical protein